MKLDELTLDQLNWTNRLLGELKLDKSREYPLKWIAVNVGKHNGSSIE